jgi:hypothetical protein
MQNEAYMHPIQWIIEKVSNSNELRLYILRLRLKYWTANARAVPARASARMNAVEVL